MKRDAEFVVTPPGTTIGNSLAILTLTLKNCSETAQYFCARFAFVPVVGEVWPKLTGPSGSTVPFSVRVRLAQLRASDFVLLQPGEAVVAGVRLSGNFKLDQAGIYTLSAKYVSREVPPQLEKEPVFLGELESEAVQFTV